eukprot:7575036-Pyramimonas_sp.AAC.2
MIVLEHRCVATTRGRAAKSCANTKSCLSLATHVRKLVRRPARGGSHPLHGPLDVILTFVCLLGLDGRTLPDALDAP